MTHDIEVLRSWARACLFVTALCTTAFPIMYAFSPWFKSPIGRALMIQAIAFATAVDLTLVVMFWRPTDILVLFWLNAFVFTFIASATAWLTITMVKANYKKHSKKKETRMTLLNETPSEDPYTPKHVEPKGPLLSNETYDKLKPAAALLFPALIAFWMTIATIWHLPMKEEVGATLSAVNVFLGVVLVVATKLWNKSDAKYDGVINVTEHPDGFKTASLELKNYENPGDVVQQDQAIFKVNKL